ncbi:MFS transporter [Streptomyces adustus]|uniref:MFS transporter n=1 Tax=Streptomyces adustus TaxID=1609272 RepID=UPI0035E084F0
MAVVGFLVLVELVSGLLQGMMPSLLPRIGAELHVGAGDLSWVSSAQLLSSAVCVPLFARLGDMYGHRRLLRVAVVTLAAGSVLVALLLGIGQGSHWGWTDARTLGLFTIAVVACAVWTRVELRVAEPLVDLQLITRRDLLPVYVAAFMVGVAVFGAQTAASLFVAGPPKLLGYGFGYDTLGIAWILLPSGLCALLAAGVSGRLAKTVRSRTLLAGGGVLMCAGYLVLTALHDQPWQFVVANCLIGFGTGLCLSAMPALILDASPADRTGIATGIHNTTKTIGGSVASAVFAAVLTALTLPGTQVPTENAYRTVWACCAGVALLVTLSACTVRPSSPATRPAGQPQPAAAA